MTDVYIDDKSYYNYHNIESEPHIIPVVLDIAEPITQIGYLLSATGETSKTTVTNGKLHMMQGRIYYIPVTTNADSDNYQIKIMSDIADKIDVRFVKDGFVCIVPLQHNVILRNGQRVCLLTK